MRPVSGANNLISTSGAEKNKLKKLSAGLPVPFPVQIQCINPSSVCQPFQNVTCFSSHLAGMRALPGEKNLFASSGHFLNIFNLLNGVGENYHDSNSKNITCWQKHGKEPENSIKWPRQFYFAINMHRNVRMVPPNHYHLHFILNSHMKNFLY